MRYVILHHEDIPNPHFDLLFETSPIANLVTWRSDVWPILTEISLLKQPDHRREYLVYEGPVSGDRGRVTRVEAGEYYSRIDIDGDWFILFTTQPSGWLSLRHDGGDRWNASGGRGTNVWNEPRA